MTKFYCAKIAQEHCETIRNAILASGVPPENILLSDNCLGCLIINVRFEDFISYNKFCQKQLSGIIEVWS